MLSDLGLASTGAPRRLARDFSPRSAAHWVGIDAGRSPWKVRAGPGFGGRRPLGTATILVLMDTGHMATCPASPAVDHERGRPAGPRRGHPQQFGLDDGADVAVH